MTDDSIQDDPVGDTALLVVDVQRDFLPGGALPVPQGARVVPPLNRCIARYAAERRPVLLSRDWHPAGHCSFASRGGLQPSHCVAGTEGAAFAAGLTVPANALVVSKGGSADIDAESCFDSADLAQRLKRLGVRRLVVGGLATDACVLHTVLDALQLGFEVSVMTDAVAAMNVKAGDGDRALRRMAQAGAQLVSSEEVAAS